MAFRIRFVEDDVAIAEFVAQGLRVEGFLVEMGGIRESRVMHRMPWQYNVDRRGGLRPLNRRDRIALREQNRS